MRTGRFQMPKNVIANARVRKQLLYDAVHVPGAMKAIYDACASDPIFYINAFVWTYDPRKKSAMVPFVTYGFQDDAIMTLLDAIDAGVDVGIKKSRDMGASWVNLCAIEWMWHFRDLKSFLVVSRNENYVDASGDSKSLFWKIDFIHEHLPKWLMPKSKIRRQMHIENGDNGSIIDGESTTGDVARGDRRTAILLDEFAAFDTKSGYNALSATQSATNCRIFNSTPKGVANAFHDVIFKSSAKIIEMHWSLHPMKNRGLYTSVRDDKTGRMELQLLSKWKGVVDVCEKGSKKTRKVAFPEDYPFILDGKKRSPWYDRECSRAVNPIEISQELDIDFYGSDYQFFDVLAVERYKEKWCRKPEAVGDLEINQDCQVLRFTPNRKGKFRLFEALNGQGRVDADRRFVMGVDVAAGTGASNSTIAVYDRQSNEKVAEYANPNTLPDDFGRFVVAVARFYNDAKIVPDRSGPTGEVLVRRILSESYTNMYFRRNTKKVGAPVTDEPGVYLNPQTKTTILQQYRDAIGHVTIINCSEVAMDECLRFVMTQSGNVEHSAEANATDPSGARLNHGDLVIADALAVLALTETEDRDIPQEQVIPEHTLAWRMEQDRIARMQETADDLGGIWEV